MELTIKKEVNPNEVTFMPLGIGGIYNLMLGNEYIGSVHEGQKDKMQSILSMAAAYYNFMNRNPDDLKDEL